MARAESAGFSGREAIFHGVRASDRCCKPRDGTATYGTMRGGVVRSSARAENRLRRPILLAARPRRVCGPLLPTYCTYIYDLHTVIAVLNPLDRVGNVPSSLVSQGKERDPVCQRLTYVLHFTSTVEAEPGGTEPVRSKPGCRRCERPETHTHTSARPPFLGNSAAWVC